MLRRFLIEGSRSEAGDYLLVVIMVAGAENIYGN